MVNINKIKNIKYFVLKFLNNKKKIFEIYKKGWFGTYSKVESKSIEKYHILIHKEEIIKNEHKN